MGRCAAYLQKCRSRRLDSSQDLARLVFFPRCLSLNYTVQPTRPHRSLLIPTQRKYSESSRRLEAICPRLVAWGLSHFILTFVSEGTGSVYQLVHTCMQGKVTRPNSSGIVQPPRVVRDIPASQLSGPPPARNRCSQHMCNIQKALPNTRCARHWYRTLPNAITHIQC